MKPSLNKVPRHLAVVLDGNRRLAKRLVMKPWKGHEWGARKVEKLIEWCISLKIKELSLYAFSVENFNRPKEEFDYLMNLFIKEFTRFKDDQRIKKHGIKVNFLGRIHMFPVKVQKLMYEIMSDTDENKGFILNFAMAYGGRTEVIDAVKKIAEKIEDGHLRMDEINDEVFSNFLYTDHEPDLIIRTGGERRTSNFLIWQSAYSEWIFLEKMWPEFEKEDLIKCLQDYARRERRFGK